MNRCCARPLSSSERGKVEEAHEMSLALRTFVGVSRDAELLQPAAERVGMEFQNACGALRGVNYPVRLVKDGQDVVTFDVFQRSKAASLFFVATTPRGGVPRSQDVRADFERCTRSKNHGTFDDV